MDRREFLKRSSFCAAGVLSAGCSQLSSASDEVVLRSVHIVNLNEQSNEALHVAISRGGEILLDETYDVPKKDGVVAGTTVADGFPRKLGEYSLEANLVGRSKAATATVTAEDLPEYYSGTCITVRITVFDGGKVGVITPTCASTTN